MPFRYWSKHQFHFPREGIVKVLQCWINDDKICSLLILWFVRVGKPKFTWFMKVCKFNVYANHWSLQDYSTVANGDSWTKFSCIRADLEWDGFAIQVSVMICSGGNFLLQSFSLFSPIKSSWSNGQNLWLQFRDKSKKKRTCAGEKSETL